MRYRAAKPLDATTMTTFRDLVPTKLAAAVYDCLMKYKDANPDFLPATETCELLILGRSVDQVFKCTYILVITLHPMLAVRHYIS